ncbi:Polyketide synthase dehydratase [Mucilaginibacter pineti]|uniref:Polyketide synthase dehydratase n=1 Tax=Mucilaginibacter pineti TaxID=1391627 RepID=A0A1G7P068_9SPHI|nr:SDR family NAD(P)-dependent oxidoreductase [Mucilaginibacter pineti]SDF79019.1 Polyketide synthase dehydratase [Mucilaginibacter pineti]
MPETALQAISLAALANVNETDHTAMVGLNTHAFHTARTIGKNLSEQAGTFILAFDSGLSEHIPGRAWSAGISALAKTAAIEWPQADVRSIDIATPGLSNEEISERLFKVITAGGDITELVVDKHGRYLSFMTTAEAVTNHARPFIDGDTLIVSGGAKGIAAACLVELASRVKLNFGILGRSVFTEEPAYLAAASSEAELRKVIMNDYTRHNKKILPVELNRIVSGILGQREIKNTISQLENKGSKITYLPVDVANLEEVVSATAIIRNQYGPISGLIHAAGVLADKLIHEKTDDQFNKVFATKITGFANLLAATTNDPLTHICCFSSVAARLGNRGQVAYAMANEILNKVCHDEQRGRGEQCVVKSINWGPWDGGMVSPQLKKHFEEMGVALIPLTEGARIFADEMEDGSTASVETVVGGLLSAWNARGGAAEETAAVWIHQSNNPFLADHVIEGHVIAPLMMVTEWCLRLAKKTCPEFKNVTVTSMSVYKGIVLDNYRRTGDILTFDYTTSRQRESAVINITIKGEEKRTLYAAQINLDNELPIPLIQVSPSLEDWNWDQQDIYPSRLFHGETFKVIDQLEGFAPSACRAKLRVPKELYGNALSTMLLFDGGIQVAILAMEKQMGNSSSLPLGFRSLTMYADESTNVLICELSLISSGEKNAEWNIRFIDTDNRVIADLFGLKMFMYK